MTTTPRRTRALAAALALAALVGAAAPAAASGQEDPALAQQVDGDETTAGDRVVIGTGHVDVGPRLVDGTWSLQARDDRAVPAVWRPAADTVLQVTDAALLAVPDSADYAFLGVDPGTPVHVVPQVQNPDVVWIGWNTQDPGLVAQVDRGATLTLHGAQGPGQVLVFLQEGVAGAPRVLWDSARSGPQDIWMDVSTHVHANWVFTEPGVYLLDVEVSADLLDGRSAADRTVLRLAVGDVTDPQEALSATLEAPAAEPTASPAAAPAEVGDDGVSAPVVGALVGAGVAVLVVVAVGGALTARRRRLLADAQHDGQEPR